MFAWINQSLPPYSLLNMAKYIKDLAVYLNTINFIGMISEFDKPVVAATTAAHETLGMIGTQNVPVGFEPMTARIAWMGKSVPMAILSYDLEGVVDLQVREVLEDNTGVITRTGIVSTIKGRFQSTDGGKLSAKAMSTAESTLDVFYWKEVLDGKTLIEVDFNNNIYIVNGVDKYKERNKILGIV